MTIPKSSLAMVLTGPRTLELHDIPIPHVTADTAILRVEACGICGTDLEQYHGALAASLPLIPGHEIVGIVEKIGDEAASRWGVDVGDRVAVEPLLACQACNTCRSGMYHICGSRKLFSFISLSTLPGLWGGYAEYMALPRNTVVHKIDAKLPVHLATMFNPLGAGFRWAVELPQTKVGDSVVILGPGQRGLASVVAARIAGAKTIIVSGTGADTKKLELARIFGADHTIDVESENLVHRVRELTNGVGADVVIDLTPYATAPVAQSLRCARLGGTVVLAGVKGRLPIPNFVSDLIVFKELTIKGAYGVMSSSYMKAIDLIESRTLPLDLMHTHDFPLIEAERALKTLGREIPGVESIHSCIVPQ